MKDNKEILNEAFFKRKKESYAEKLNKTMPQYKPVDKKAENIGFGSIFGDKSVNKQGDILRIVDTDAAKKRLTGALGMVLGNSTVKGMADKAIKKFPIIVSENIEPETVAMIKSLTEEQYADYINLMVSNQMIDLAEYEPNNPEGNIAIQALDKKLSSPEFGSQKLVNKAQSGSLSFEDLLGNLPIFQMIRHESLKTGNSILDNLLENAIIVKSEDADNVCKCLQENASEYLFDSEIINEEVTAPEATEVQLANVAPYVASQTYADKLNKSTNKVKNALSVDTSTNKTSQKGKDVLETNKIKSYADRSKYGLIGVDSHGNEIFNKLTNTNVTIDKAHLDSALNNTVGEILSKNEYLKDRFEKATFLLTSRRIAGAEYIDYCTKRLGLPVSDRARRELVRQFRIKDIQVGGFDEKTGEFNTISANDVSKIAKNVRIVNNYMAPVLKVKIKDVITGASVGAGVAIASSSIAVAANAANIAAGIAGSVIPVIGWVALAGAIGGGIATYIIKKIQNKNRNNIDIDKLNRIEGWERVESLIDQMDKNIIDLNLRAKKFELEKKNLANIEKNFEKSKANLSEHAFNRLYKGLNDKPLHMDSLKEGYEISEDDFSLEEGYILSESLINSMFENCNEGIEDANISYTESDYKKFLDLTESIADGILADEELLHEASISTTVPVTVKKIKYDPKEFMVAPTYGTKDLVAYGSVEYDQKAIKDRRYNTPLILTVKFKERYSDGKYSDNELTAVIGILGVVTRVPSDEMAYVLKANANGVGIKDIFKADKPASETISDLMSKFKVSNNADKLPTSGEVWHNLEKVSLLAVANKLAGKASGNISNAHIIFSQKEIDDVRLSDGVDYLKDSKLANSLMKRYSAVTLMAANDVAEKLYIFDDPDNISWNVVPYASLRAKGGSDNLTATLNQIARKTL